MERHSLLYKGRRTAQILAHKMFSDEALSKFYFRIVLKQKLNIDNPQTFNEKMQWLKLYYCPFNDTVTKCTDKYAVRNIIKDKGYGHLLVPLAGSWETAEQIEWNKLPNQFVLKCNHGCAYNILCHDKSKFDTKKATFQLKKWMKEDFGAFNIEPHYSRIKPHMIICEEFLGDSITDFKFFCFNGKPEFIYISNDLVHDRQAKIGFFYLDGTKMPIKREDYTEIESIMLPNFFDEMYAVAKVLCKEFPFVRVDFFIANRRYYFAELTFTPSACMMPFNLEKYDYEWGEMLDISEAMKKYGKRQ